MCCGPKIPQLIDVVLIPYFFLKFCCKEYWNKERY